MNPLKALGATVVSGILLVAAAPVQAHGPGGSGYGGWGMMGPGYGPHHGYGGWGMMGRGYGPGYGMHRGYGPGYGMHRGWGPGMGWGALPSNLTVDQVRHMLAHEIQWSGNANLEVGKVEKSGDDTITAEIVDKDGKVVTRYEIDVHTGSRRRTG